MVSLREGGAGSSQSVSVTPRRREPGPRWARRSWLFLLALALTEVVALGVRVARVPSEESWAAAARLIDTRWRERDAVVVAPEWADPLLRQHLGDRISLSLAGRVDLAGFERLWVISARGARAAESPPRDPDFVHRVGRLTVERYDFAPSPVLHDLVQELERAEVSIVRRGQERPCPLRTVREPARGGLGFGPVPPAQRFVCDASQRGLWVGRTILEDLSLAPRRCIWQHPQGSEPVAVTFRDVLLGDHLVVHAGLDYHDERDEIGAEVTMRVLLGERELARLVHRDGDGMRRYEVRTQELSPSMRGDLRFEVTSPDPRRRSFCWAGSIRDTQRREGT